MLPSPLEAGLALAALGAAALGTAAMVRYGRRALLDLPNERSSHTRPTPRGGGAAIVAAFVAASLALWALGGLPGPLLLALAGGGGLVAAVGFADDHRHVPAVLRLGVHLAAASLAVAVLGAPRAVAVGSLTLELPAAVAAPLAVVAIAWLLNLTNFMDGIDGIAGTETVTVAVPAALLFAAAGTPLPGLWLLAGAAAGFLLHNWPPARIFMGDVGSGFLGFALGVYALAGAHAHPAGAWAWGVLLAAFWADASVTLVRRLLRGERVHEAHRLHAYQRWARRLGAHRPVTLAFGAVNLAVLAPLAAACLRAPEAAAGWAAAGGAAMLGVALAAGAGRRD